MKSYSQSCEDLIILDYFGGFIGNLLSVGENDGTTLSNAKLLIEHGFSACLIEPSSTFNALQELHKNNHKVKCYNFGLSDKNETVKFYESANHVPNGSDRALVSSAVLRETERWRVAGVQFETKQIEVKTFKKFMDLSGETKFDFISIDCEGFDWRILKQINLTKVGCRLLIIEWNGDVDCLEDFTNYCGKFGLYEIHRTRENLVFAL